MSYYDDASLMFLAGGGAQKDGTAYSVKPVPVYGSDEVTNGDFSTDTNWVKGTGWTISGGTANSDGTQTTNSNLNSQTFVVGSNPTLKLTFDVTNYSAGTLNAGITGTGQADITNINANGTYSVIVVSSAGNRFVNFVANPDFIGSIDNVSVKEVLAGDGDFTFSRGSNLAATRVGAGPNYYIEKGRENQILHSNDITTSPWRGEKIFSETQGHTGYDGSNDAWLIIPNSTSDTHYKKQSVSTTSGVTTISAYVKSAGYNFLTIRDDSSGNSYARFDLVTGVTSTTGANAITSKIESVGNDGWWRCSLTYQETLTGNIIFYVNNSYGYAVAYAGDEVSGIYLMNVQVELGLVATDYIETGASTAQAGILEDTPRFDYSNGASCPSLLLEPSRSQLIKFSEYYGDNLLVNATIDTNNATSPEGIQNATLLIENTSSGNHALRENESTQIAADDSQYVISFYAKSNGRNIRFIDDGYSGSGTIVNFNLSSGGTFSNGALVIDSDAVAVGSDGWYYCYGVIDKAANQSNFRFSLRLLGGASNINDSYTGDGTSSVWIWGKQIEDASSYPTSYIPNHSGGTITRAADVCGDAGDANTFNSTEGVLYAEVSFARNKGKSSPFKVDRISLSDGTANNRVLISNTTTDNQIIAFIKNSSGTIFNETITITDITANNKIAVRYESGNYALYINGVKEATGTSTNVPSGLNDLMFDGPSGNYAFEGKVKQVLTFNTALSDADLAALTTI